jgi:UDP-glucose 4-epimerase
MVMPRFVRQALAEHPITVYGDGQQSRCFCHVSDVIRALNGLVEQEAWGEVFNIGSTEEITILDLARRVKDLAESESEIRIVPYEEAFDAGYEDMQKRVPDTSKINDLIGWEPRHALDETIRQVIASQREAIVV